MVRSASPLGQEKVVEWQEKVQERESVCWEPRPKRVLSGRHASRVPTPDSRSISSAEIRGHIIDVCHIPTYR